MMSSVKVAAVQMSCSEDREENISKAERMVRSAAAEGANIILLPELFELPYFCQEKNYDYYYLADKTEDNPAVKRFKQVAKETGTVIP
ncbi:MAG: N-carbamoylputrescine amidase, partial [Ruminiclostridium sp.]|nr:N-carbamoylputrescine amidase [Ruminiclostridium sp.]